MVGNSYLDSIYWEFPKNIFVIELFWFDIYIYSPSNFGLGNIHRSLR